MPGFPLAAIGAGLGLFAKQYQEQQAQKERNAMLQMQMQRFQQEMRDRQGQEELSRVSFGDAATSVQPTPGGASAVPPISGGLPTAPAMPSGGGGGGSGGYWTPAGITALQQTEDARGWNNVHYPSGKTASGVASTASGGAGYLDRTWREFAPKAGVDLTQYPRAYMAPEDVQRKVIAITPISHWTGSKNGVPWNPAAQQLARNPAYVTGAAPGSGGGFDPSGGAPIPLIGPDSQARRNLDEGRPLGAPSDAPPPARISAADATRMNAADSSPGTHLPVMSSDYIFGKGKPIPPGAGSVGGEPPVRIGGGSIDGVRTHPLASSDSGAPQAGRAPAGPQTAGPGPAPPEYNPSTVAAAIKRQQPNISNKDLVGAVEKVGAFIGPQVKAAYDRWKTNAEMYYRGRSAEATEAAHAETGRHNLVEEGFGGKRLEQTGQAQAETGRHNVATETLGQGQLAETKRQHDLTDTARKQAVDAKLKVAQGKTDTATIEMKTLASRARDLYSAVEQNPNLVGVRGRGARFFGGVQEQAKIKQEDEASAAFLSELNILKAGLQASKFQGARYFSPGAIPADGSAAGRAR